MSVVRKTPTYQKLEEVAEKIPAPVSWFIPDPEDPSSYIHPITGFTKQAAIKIAKKAMKDPAIPPVLRTKLKKDLNDLIKVIKATPKKAIDYVGEFHISPALSTLGSFHPNAIRLFPDEDNIMARVAGKPVEEVSGAGAAHAFAHEAAHGGTMRIFERLIRKLFSEYYGNEPITTLHASLGYHAASEKAREAFEGAAEYIGVMIKKKAGVDPIPFFGHGSEQEAVYNLLSAMPSKNPWMNIRKYFKSVIDEIHGISTHSQDVM